MEGQNTSSHTILPPGFTNSSFASTFTGIASPAGNVSNPLLMSTLHHLQGLSAAGGATLLPSTSQLALSGQFASEFNNIAAMGWPSQNASAAWFEQAKVAAMLPMYGVLSASGVKTGELPIVDANALTPPMRTESIQECCAAVPLTTITPSAAPGSGIFPLNPIGFMSLPQEQSPQQSVTPQRIRQSTKSLHSSPADSMLNADAQPSSIHSHCSADLRTGSSSAMSSHGPSSVSAHSNIGSVEPLNIQPDSVPTVSGLVSTEIVGPGSAQGGSIYSVMDTRSSVSHPSSVEASTSAATPGSQSSGVQQVAYDLSTGSQQQALQKPSLSNGHVESTNIASSNEIIQDFSLGQERQTPGSSHENALDTGNLDDLPWSSIDLGDIDLFGGASAADKDVMHSVLDMDPTVMHRLFNNEPSSSNSGPSELMKAQKTPPPQLSSIASQVVTPKIREKIKMRREKELADADKELDRLLSLVAKKDARTAHIVKAAAPVPFFDPLLFAKCDSSSDDKKISLSPVQFTPPDSPTPSTSSLVPPSAGAFFFRSSGLPSTSSTANVKASAQVQRPEPSTSVAPFVFMPPIEKKNRSNKVPVYKQKTKTFSMMESKTEEVNKIAGDDAYSFTDDEDDDKPLPSGAVISETQLKEQRLEAEVAQKLAKINSAHPELKGKGGGYEAQSQQDLWRHVVPKKRHTAAVAERPSIPSTPLLPPASVSEQRVDPGTSTQKVPEVLTLAESLQRRKQYRSSYGFLKTKCLDDNCTAKGENVDKPAVFNIKVEPSDDFKSENGTAPQYRPLPKLLIRLPKRSREESPPRSEISKKKKKKKKKDRDREWEGSEKKKRKKKHKHKHHKHIKHEQEYEAHLITIDDDQNRPSEPVNRPSDMAMFSKKRRLMMQWKEAEEHSAEISYRCEESRRNSRSGYGDMERRYSQVDANNEWNAPAKFSQANGQLAKGTFVVCKADILKEDCPLWRVDNQNLLQKYPPTKLNGKIAYKNSSTYSGWCDQIADGYLVVQVKFIKHTRSESIIDPEMPLLDMFPAISTELDEKPSQSADSQGSDSYSSHNYEADMSLKDPISDQMVTYIRAMLNHGLTLSFLQSVKQGNDWNYLRALNDIDKINQERKEKVQSRVKWVERYIEMLHFYSCCVSNDAEGSGLNCQACGNRPVEKVVQLFSNEGYDYDTLESEEMRYTGSGSPMPAMEYLVCSVCAKLSLTYHKLHHMRYLLLKKCEDQMEIVSCENVELSSELVVETCMKNMKWLHSVISEYADLWRKIEMNDC